MYKQWNRTCRCWWLFPLANSGLCVFFLAIRIFTRGLEFSHGTSDTWAERVTSLGNLSFPARRSWPSSESTYTSAWCQVCGFKEEHLRKRVPLNCVWNKEYHICVIYDERRSALVFPMSKLLIFKSTPPRRYTHTHTYTHTLLHGGPAGYILPVPKMERSVLINPELSMFLTNNCYIHSMKDRRWAEHLSSGPGWQIARMAVVWVGIGRWLAPAISGGPHSFLCNGSSVPLMCPAETEGLSLARGDAMVPRARELQPRCSAPLYLPG